VEREAYEFQHAEQELTKPDCRKIKKIFLKFINNHAVNLYFENILLLSAFVI